MSEKIIQGKEDPAEATARRAAWQARDRDPANTATTLEDLERVVRGLPGVDAAMFAAAKRDRGKPLP